MSYEVGVVNPGWQVSRTIMNPWRRNNATLPVPGEASPTA